MNEPPSLSPQRTDIPSSSRVSSERFPQPPLHDAGLQAPYRQEKLLTKPTLVRGHCTVAAADVGLTKELRRVSIGGLFIIGESFINNLSNRSIKALQLLILGSDT